MPRPPGVPPTLRRSCIAHGDTTSAYTRAMADARAAGPPIPGVVIVWSGEGPLLQPLRLPSLGLILGRELLGPKATDDRISRQHARVRWNGTSFAITDLGSRNGTYVGGTLVSENEVTVTPP